VHSVGATAHFPALSSKVIRWHDQIGDPTAADGILDRLVHRHLNAQKFDAKESRKPIA
jgi:hypothetical protein